jgi:hypothetical protein
MATKKARPAALAKAAATEEPPRAVAPAVLLATPDRDDTQQLLREAAWSRMFGRAETKNPFAPTR